MANQKTEAYCEVIARGLASGLTQAEIAKKLGISQRTIQKYRADARLGPMIRQLQRQYSNQLKRQPLLTAVNDLLEVLSAATAKLRAEGDFTILPRVADVVGELRKILALQPDLLTGGSDDTPEADEPDSEMSEYLEEVKLATGGILASTIAGLGKFEPLLATDRERPSLNPQATRLLVEMFIDASIEAARVAEARGMKKQSAQPAELINKEESSAEE